MAYGVTFQVPARAGGLWIASVAGGYTAKGRTKRLAQRALKAAVPPSLWHAILWVREDSPFLSGGKLPRVTIQGG